MSKIIIGETEYPLENLGNDKYRVVVGLYVYIGGLKDGKRHGKGTFSGEDYSYDGYWENDMMTGYGVMKCNKFEYHGDFLHDLFHGHGKITFQNGITYIGNWVNSR